ncbi:hypothetical protein DKX38_027055 [Salix brachista]|uniref:SPX domain-containing protein n=1 Tax=Salix brachista TaxID=2182728 RepID=A0A5N5JMX8_9ROSI|nr:hypothetical protein DKX38_027055 [Salix brachista]
MKFGKEFKTHLEETLPGWRDKFLCYKPLKKLLKQLPPTVDYLNLDRPINFQHHQHPPPLTGDVLDNIDRPLVDLQEWFVGILNEELDKFNDFYVDKEEDFAFVDYSSGNLRYCGLMVAFKVFPICMSCKSELIDSKLSMGLEGVDEVKNNFSSLWYLLKMNRIGLDVFFPFHLNAFVLRLVKDSKVAKMELKERIESLKEKSSKDGVFTSESEFSEEMMDIRKDLVTIHGEMVLLKNYSSLNFAGLVKILKKYDKRTGGLLRLPFTQLALHQPFFTTEPLTRLVHECEDNLELLFPLEAEVIESTNVAQDQSNPSLNNTTKISPEPSTTLGRETIDIYRSTLAAMKAIRGLQKASSTSNPLSFSSFFKIQDDESTGAVTAANSTSNSSATMHDGEEIDQEDLHSV